MTSFGLDYNGDNVEDPDRPYPITDPADLDQDLAILGHHAGELGSRLLAQLGPQGGDPALLFGIDAQGANSGRAVIQWLPTGEFGWHPDVPAPATPVTFDGRFISAARAEITYPPEATQVTPGLVQNAIRQYTKTANRPTTLQWRTTP